MPTYAYECTNKKCKFEFDEIQSMSDAKLKACPMCRRNTLIRLIGTGSGIITQLSATYKDLSGESVYCPTGGYFDTAMRRHFTSAKEKFEFMKENKIVSNGDNESIYKKQKKEHYEKTNDLKEKKHEQ